MLRKPCRLQTDGRTDGQGESSIPPNFVGRGYNNNSDNDGNNDNDDNNKIPVASPLIKGPIILRFHVTFVESKNSSRVSGDLRRHVPHVTSL